MNKKTIDLNILILTFFLIALPDVSSLLIPGYADRGDNSIYSFTLSNCAHRLFLKLPRRKHSLEQENPCETFPGVFIFYGFKCIFCTHARSARTMAGVNGSIKADPLLAAEQKPTLISVDFIHGSPTPGPGAQLG